VSPKKSLGCNMAVLGSPLCPFGRGYLSRYSDSPRAGRSGNRIPVGVRLSAPVHTGPGVHPASYAVGTGSFPRVKRRGRGLDHPPQVKERVVTPLPPLCAFVACFSIHSFQMLRRTLCSGIALRCVERNQVCEI
jgi:hypothetical protein